MATEMITLKLDERFLAEIDGVVGSSGYQTRTEFIRNALREKIDDIKLKNAMLNIAHLKGASKKKTSEADAERIRQAVFDEFSTRVR